MKRTVIKSVVFLVGFIWIVATGMGGAPWPVIAIPPILLFAMIPADPVPPALSELVTQLKVLNDRFGTIDDHVRAIDQQLDRHGEHLAHLVDEQPHAMRQRGEIPWPSKA